MLVLAMALRNVFRQKRRSLLTALTMFGGFILCSFSIAMSDGSYNHVIDMFTRNQMGHIQIHKGDYLDRPSLYKTIDDYEQVGARVSSVSGVTAWTPRVLSAGLVSVDEKSAGAQIFGIDPKSENAATRFEKKIVEGRALDAEPNHEAVLGPGLAKLLKANVGDELLVLSQGADGSIANDLYNIVGLAATDNKGIDLSALYLHLSDAQELLVLEGRVHELVVMAGELGSLDEVAADVRAAVDDSTLDVATWQQFAAAFYRAMKADQKGNWISVTVILIVVAVGVLNTVLMTVLERRREYGLLRAIGTGPGQVFGLVMIEVVILAIMSLIIGSLIAYGLNWYYSIHGMSFGESWSYGGVEFGQMFTEINARSFYIPGLAVVISAALVAIVPALRAAHVAPARAMRMH